MFLRAFQRVSSPAGIQMGGTEQRPQSPSPVWYSSVFRTYLTPLMIVEFDYRHKFSTRFSYVQDAGYGERFSAVMGFVVLYQI